MGIVRQLACVGVLLGSVGFSGGCGDDEGGGVYCCTYETRHTACGGSGWTDWASEFYQFNLDDYLEGWTAERVCDKFTGSDTECSATCCINAQSRNNELTSGSCPSD